MGKKKQTTTGYEYSGSSAQAICAGPVDELIRIWNGDTVIWEGPALRSGADADGKTILTTSIGTIHFYWGTATQTVSAILDAVKIDSGSGPVTVPWPAFRGVCYAILDRVAFGQQLAPPTLNYELRRATAGLTLSAHDIAGDAVLPEFVYELLTNTSWGAGVSTALVDATSFAAAAETIISEGLGVSPMLDEETTLRDVLGRLYPYTDLLLYYDDGKIRCKLVRYEDPSTSPQLDESDLLEEPQPANTFYSDTANTTLVTYTDRDNKWEDSTEAFHDPANLAMMGEAVEKTLDFPWVTQKAVAQLLVKRKGVLLGMPGMTYAVRVKPASAAGLQVGSIVRLSYAKLSMVNRVCRVMGITRGDAQDPEVDLDLQEDLTRDESKDFLAPVDNGFETFTDGDGNSSFALTSTTPRLLVLPPGLQTGDDGWLTACEQPAAAIDGFSMHFSWDPVQNPYTVKQVAVTFPAKLRILGWRRINAVNWLMRVEAATDRDLEFVQALDGDAAAVYLVSAERLLNHSPAKDQHQTEGVWLRKVNGGQWDPVAGRVIDLEMVGAAFGSDNLAMEAGGADGVYPCVHAYLGRVGDFCVQQDDVTLFARAGANGQPYYDGSTTVYPDTALVRYVKVTTMNVRDEQALADVTASTFDRDDTTMSPGGTFSVTWGEYGPTWFEAFDIAEGAAVLGGTHPDAAAWLDVSLALYAMVFNVDDSADYVLADELDTVLGSMIISGRTYYSPVP